MISALSSETAPNDRALRAAAAVIDRPIHAAAHVTFTNTWGAFAFMYAIPLIGHVMRLQGRKRADDIPQLTVMAVVDDAIEVVALPRMSANVATAKGTKIIRTYPLKGAEVSTRKALQGVDLLLGLADGRRFEFNSPSAPLGEALALAATAAAQRA